MGKMTLLIGGTGQGKSTFLRNMINGEGVKPPCFIYDVNAEHNYLPFDNNAPRGRYFGDMREFIKMCENKHGGTYCVFEEATGFFVGAMQKNMRQLCIGKRHPVAKGGRNLVFIFHSISSVPPFLFDMADYTVLFKTNDDVNTIKRKREKMLPYFIEVSRRPQFKPLVIKNIV